MAEVVRVVIADDRASSRDGLRALLASCCGTEVVGTAPNGSVALQLVEEYHPDVVVMEIEMPGLDGLATTRVIKEHWPEVRVVLLNMYSLHSPEALASGADAFLVKGCSTERLFEAVLGQKEGET